MATGGESKKTSRRGFVKTVGVGIGGLVIGALAGNSLKICLPAESSPKPPPTAPQTIFGFDMNLFQDSAAIFRDKTWDLKQTLDAIICNPCQPIVQACSIYRYIINPGIIANYTSLVQSLLSGGLSQTRDSLKAFTDINGTLGNIISNPQKNGDLDYVQLMLQNIVSNADNSSALAFWNASHEVNLNNDQNGAGSREWYVMSSEENYIKGAIIPDNSLTKENMENLLRIFKVQAGYLSRNGAYSVVAGKALDSLENGAKRLQADFDAFPNRDFGLRDGVDIVYDGVRQFFGEEMHVEIDASGKTLQRPYMWGLCDYPEEERRPFNDDVTGINDTAYDALHPQIPVTTSQYQGLIGTYDVQHRLLKRMTDLVTKVGDKSDYLLQALQSATPDQRFRFYWALEQGVDPLTKDDYLNSQATTLHDEVGIENATFEAIIRATSPRRAALDAGTARDAWDPRLTKTIEGLSRSQGINYVEEEIANRIVGWYEFLRTGEIPEPLCILERVGEIYDLKRGDRATFTIVYGHALHRVGGEMDLVRIRTQDGGFHSYARTIHDGTPDRVIDWDYAKNKLVFNKWNDHDVSLGFEQLATYFKSSTTSATN